MMKHMRDVSLFEYFEKKFVMKNAKEMFSHVSKHYLFLAKFNCFAHRWIKSEIFRCQLISVLIVLDFFCNLAMIVKMHHDNSNDDICNRKTLHAFYDHFDEIMNENDDDNEIFSSNFDYSFVKLVFFKFRRARRFKKFKQKVRMTISFEKSKVSEDYDAENEFWRRLRKLNCCLWICFLRVLFDHERDVDDDELCFLIVFLDSWAWRWS